MDQQQQQQMALQQQQQQLQLQQQQQLGQAVNTNNQMMANENTVGAQLFQQTKQLTQINSSNPQSLQQQQQQQQQSYGLVNASGGYVQQVAQVSYHNRIIRIIIPFYFSFVIESFSTRLFGSNLSRVEWRPSLLPSNPSTP
jgi:hypothetical protein